MQNWTLIKGSEICYVCGYSVKVGSGSFVNRIPSFSSYEERVEMNVPFPQGNWLCESCDAKTIKTILITVEKGAVAEVNNVPFGWDYQIIDLDENPQGDKRRKAEFCLAGK